MSVCVDLHRAYVFRFIWFRPFLFGFLCIMKRKRVWEKQNIARETIINRLLDHFLYNIQLVDWFENMWHWDNTNESGNNYFWRNFQCRKYQILCWHWQSPSISYVVLQEYKKFLCQHRKSAGNIENVYLYARLTPLPLDLSHSLLFPWFPSLFCFLLSLSDVVW